MVKLSHVETGSPQLLPNAPFDEIPDTIDLGKWQRMVDLLASIFSAPATAINRVKGSQVEVVIASGTPNNPYHAGDTVSEEVNIYCHKVIRTREMLYVANASIGHDWFDNPEVIEDGFVSYLGIPLFWPDGSVFGSLCVFDRVETEYRENFKAFLHLLKEMIESDLSYVKLTKDLKQISNKDELTGLNNRRGFMEYANSFISSARRHHHFIALIYFDLDNLKTVNDQYGHEAGDLYIKSFAQALMNSIRAEDIAARLGGDEFVLMTMSNDSVLFQHIENRIDKEFKDIVENIQHFSNASFSSGAKIFAPVGNMTIDTMLSETDALMYEQKRSKKSG